MVIYSTPRGRQPAAAGAGRGVGNARTEGSQSRRAGMRVAMVGLLAAGVLTAPATAGGDAAKKDMERLQGTWTVVTMEEKGSKAPEEVLKDIAVEIKGDRIIISEKGKLVVEFRYKLDAGKKPRAIDLTHLSGDEKGKTELGIYEVEGDTARFCVSDAARERPGAFGTSKDDDRNLFVIKRKK